MAIGSHPGVYESKQWLHQERHALHFARWSFWNRPGITFAKMQICKTGKFSIHATESSRSLNNVSGNGEQFRQRCARRGSGARLQARIRTTWPQDGSRSYPLSTTQNFGPRSRWLPKVKSLSDKEFGYIARNSTINTQQRNRSKAWLRAAQCWAHLIARCWSECSLWFS